MGLYTRLTRAWLDARYRRFSEEGVYYAHQPIYGISSPRSEPEALPRLARTFRILDLLDRLRFETFLDVGAGEGYLCHLVRRFFNAQVLGGDLSEEACRRADELFGVEAVALDSARLPFRDAAFDVVVSSEIVEHVEFPVETLLELDRVARGVLLVTSQEFCPDRERSDSCLSRRRDLPHTERNYFCPEDLRLVLGPEIRLSSEYRVLAPPGRGMDATGAADWIRRATELEGLVPDGAGAILVKTKRPDALAGPRLTREILLTRLLAETRPEGPLVARSGPASPSPVSGFVCPLCRAGMGQVEDGLDCARCGRRFGWGGGVRRLHDPDAPDPGPEELDRRLLSLWRRDEGRVRSVLDLRRKLELPAPSSQTVWDFSEARDCGRWLVNEELLPRTGAGPAFRWTSTGEDPWILSPLLVLPDGLAAVEVGMRVRNLAYPVDAARGQIFWMGEGDFSFDESRSVLFSPRNDGEFHTYRVELASHPLQPKGPLWVRLDPVNGPAEVDLLSLRFLPEATARSG